MTGRGIVREITGNLAKLQYCNDSECGTCDSCAKLFGRKQAVFEARKPEGLDVSPGDVVEIYMSPWKAIKAGFLVLMLPLILFFLFYFIGSSWIAVENESVSILLGVAGIALGFLVNLARKMTRKQQELPEIMRVVQEHRLEQQEA